MPAAILAFLKLFLNPMNWAKLWGFVQGVFELIGGAFRWLKEWRRKKDQEKVEDAIDKIKEAQNELDEARRREQVAHAACELEKSLGIDSGCDPKPRE